MQKQIELTDKTVLVVGLPRNAYQVRIEETIFLPQRTYIHYYTPECGANGHDIEIDADFELVGIHPELTEEECKRVVDSSEYYDPVSQPYYVPCYKDYINDIWKWTAKEAFDTLMQRLEIPEGKFAVLIKNK